MNDSAEHLNAEIAAHSPAVLDLLSARGRALYWPRGIPFQGAEARAKAHRYNATIGEAMEGGAAMILPSVARVLAGVPPEALRYAYAAGKLELRQAWRAKLLRDNPSLRSRSFGLPMVTSSISHGLSVVGQLFVDPGDRVLLTAPIWDGYRLTYDAVLGAEIATFPGFANGRFDVEAFRSALREGPAKQIVILNFPHNPTGYMPRLDELEAIRDALVSSAASGRRLLVVLDDAYFGLVYDSSAYAESPFGMLANLPGDILTVKLDGATKELFVWGLRVGFLTFAPPPVEAPEPLLAALEQKVLGAIRASVSSSSNLSQTLVLQALQSPTLEAEYRAKYAVLRARAERVREVVESPQYQTFWEPYPCNAGYFVSVRLLDVDAEALRVHLLDRYGVGVIALDAQAIRIAFSCLELEDIEPLFECVRRGIQDLR